MEERNETEDSGDEYESSLSHEFLARLPREQSINTNDKQIENNHNENDSSIENNRGHHASPFLDFN